MFVSINAILALYGNIGKSRKENPQKLTDCDSIEGSSLRRPSEVLVLPCLSMEGQILNNNCVL